MKKVLSKATQEQRALEYLQTHSRGITPLEAWIKLSIYRLAAVICVLRKKGYHITLTQETRRNQFGEPCKVSVYRLEA